METPVLSAQTLVSCGSRMPIEDAKIRVEFNTDGYTGVVDVESTNYNSGCDGGSGVASFKFQLDVGFPHTSCYPYASGGGNPLHHFDATTGELPECHDVCTGSSTAGQPMETFSGLVPGTESTASIEMCQGEAAIMECMMRLGPMFCGFDVWSDFSDYDTSKVYDGPNKYQPPRPNTYHRGGHAVVCFGWGVDESGMKYWKCMNSWGAWGEFGRGEFSIRKGADTANIESYGCSAGVIDETQIAGLPPLPPSLPPSPPWAPGAVPSPAPPPLAPPPPVIVEVFSGQDCTGKKRSVTKVDLTGTDPAGSFDACGGWNDGLAFENDDGSRTCEGRTWHHQCASDRLWDDVAQVARQAPRWDDGSLMSYQGNMTWWGSFRVMAGHAVDIGNSCAADDAGYHSSMPDTDQFFRGQTSVHSGAGCVSPNSRSSGVRAPGAFFSYVAESHNGYTSTCDCGDCECGCDCPQSSKGLEDALKGVEHALKTLTDGVGCHPAGSYLTLEDGKSIAIERAAVGTLIKTDTGFQPILGFLHDEEDTVGSYLRFTTPSASMATSPLHHAFVNGTEIDPSFIKLGDLLHTLHGLEPVTRIETLEVRGAYHPFVKGGSYYVDGILASDYYALVPKAVWLLGRAYVEARYWLGIPVIPVGKGFFPNHAWVADLIGRAGVPLWAQKTVLSPLTVASSILTELANVAAEHFPAWLGTAAAAIAVAKAGCKLRA